MTPVPFGIFDHVDRGDEPLGLLFEQRLRLLEQADAAGFRGYHVAEHHATRLGMAPSPGVYLAAAAQRTRRIRLGPLVYIVPMYPPLRLIEEIIGRFIFGTLGYERAARSLELFSREIMPGVAAGAGAPPGAAVAGQAR